MFNLLLTHERRSENITLNCIKTRFTVHSNGLQVVKYYEIHTYTYQCQSKMKYLIFSRTFKKNPLKMFDSALPFFYFFFFIRHETNLS